MKRARLCGDLMSGPMGRLYVWGWILCGMAWVAFLFLEILA